MMENLQHAEWKQNPEFVSLIVPVKSGEIEIPVANQLIKYIVGNTPKIFVLVVQYQEEESQEFLIDFTGIKAIVSPLHNVIRTGEKKELPLSIFADELKSLGSYSILRGESYVEKFLSEEGWKRQKSTFHIYNPEEFVNVLNTHEGVILPEKEEKEKKEVIAQFKDCSNCGKKININATECPYCGKEQIKHTSGEEATSPPPETSEDEDDSSLDISI